MDIKFHLLGNELKNWGSSKEGNTIGHGNKSLFGC